MREMQEEGEKALSFWEHLEVLRWTLIRIMLALVVVVGSIFTFKEFVFTKIVFGPLSSDFIFYQWLCSLADLVQLPAVCPGEFSLQLININLAGQFLAHIGASFSLGLVMIIPYILLEIWRFVQPALYPNEKKHVGAIFSSASILFYAGVGTAYLIIFPLTVRFLGSYEISSLVPNQISVQSYLGTLYILIFSMGIMFEMPVLAYLLSKIGLIHKSMLKSARSYALVVLLIIAALITPTTDPFTLMIVALPLYLLYELSIVVCRTKAPEEDED
jgi:sec-independent protein translocase protein TatC